MAEKRAGLFDDLRDTLTLGQCPECLCRLRYQLQANTTNFPGHRYWIQHSELNKLYRQCPAYSTDLPEGLPHPVDQEQPGHLIRTA